MSLQEDERLNGAHGKEEEQKNALIDAESGNNCPEEEIKRRRSLRKILKSVAEHVLFLRSNDENTKEDRKNRMQPYCVAFLVLLFVVVAIVFSVCPVYDIFKYIGHAEA